MYLVKCFTNGDTTFFKLNLHKRQAINQNSHVVAIGLCAFLSKLFNDLYFVTWDVFFVQQGNVLQVSIIKGKIIDMVIMNLSSFVRDVITRIIKILHHKALPLSICKLYII